MSSLGSRRRVVIVAVAVAAALPALALATDGSPLPGWMEHMIGQAPPAMRSPEMLQQMSSPQVQRQMENMMRSPEMQQMMGGR